jgi:hypothetical protein
MDRARGPLGCLAIVVVILAVAFGVDLGKQHGYFGGLQPASSVSTSAQPAPTLGPIHHWTLVPCSGAFSRLPGPCYDWGDGRPDHSGTFFSPPGIRLRLVQGQAPEGIRIGATCQDGTASTATGSGACSYHGGVAAWHYSGGDGAPGGQQPLDTSGCWQEGNFDFVPCP